MQTAWYRTGDERWLRLTKFFGKLFLINFAIGVVTGIVQEFQFGMNWSEYSPLRRRRLRCAAGDGGARSPSSSSRPSSACGSSAGTACRKGVHLATIWAAAIGVNLSAYFIIAANSFMQHPVGVTLQPRDQARRARQHRRRADEPDDARGLPAHRHRRLPHRRHVRGRHRRLADGAQRGRRPRAGRTLYRPRDAARRSSSWSSPASVSRSPATSRPSSCSSSSR